MIVKLLVFACTRLPALGISWTCHLDGFVFSRQASQNSHDLPNLSQTFNSELGAEIRMKAGVKARGCTICTAAAR